MWLTHVNQLKLVKGASPPSDLTAKYVFMSEIKEDHAFKSGVNENYVFIADVKVKADS